MNPHVLSISIGGRSPTATEENKKLAYLIDAKTIAILDLVSGMNCANIDHDAKIDWLELNETGTEINTRQLRGAENNLVLLAFKMNVCLSFTSAMYSYLLSIKET